MTFRPHSLPFDLWPAIHQQRWQAAFVKGGPFKPSGRAAHWRPDSERKARKGWGTWVAWNIARGHAVHESAPEDLMRPERVDAYLTDIEGTNTGWTPTNRAQELYDALRVMTPHLRPSHWEWLRTAYENLRCEAVPSRNKLERLRMAWQIEELGSNLMKDAETLPARSRRHPHGITTLERALLHRDGIILVTMIRRPFRIRNFASIRIGRHLFLDHGTGTLIFPASETKGKKTLEAPLAPHLVDGLERYIRTFRPVLLTCSGKAKHIETDALWISRDGTELAERSLHNVFRRRTEEAFGKPIPPHWFRDIDVTTLVRHDPADARITGTILGHSDPEIANRHYNHALHIEAAKRHSAVLTEWMEDPDDTRFEEPVPCVP